MGEAMAVRTICLAFFKSFSQGVMALDALKFCCSSMTDETILVVEPTPESDRVFVQFQGIFHEMAKTGDLGLYCPAQTVILVTGKALFFRNPLVF